MTEPRLYTLDLVLAANVRQQLPIQAEFVYVLEATGAFNLFLNSENNKARLEKGLKFRVPPGTSFSRFDVEDVSGAANTIRLAFGFGDFDDRRLVLSSTTTIGVTPGATTADAADVTLANGAASTILAADATRKSAIIVSDPANTVNIRLGANATVGAARGALVVPGQALVFDGAGEISGFAGAAGQKVSILIVKV